MSLLPSTTEILFAVGARDDVVGVAADLVASGVLPPGLPVHPVDANAAWARPGTRLVDGVDELARILHPERVLTSIRGA